MNFLAHLYLSGNNDEIRIGNFIGDSVKGNKYLQYNEKIQQGILLHRAIDSFTDKHPFFLLSKRKLNSRYHLFSGMVMDILYDHFLANSWEKYSLMQLDEFAQKAYSLMLSNFHFLPDEIKTYLPYMVKNNWLVLYKSKNGVERVLNGLSSRTSLPNQTFYAIEVLENNYNEIDKEFHIFFRDMINFIENEHKIDLQFHLRNNFFS